jgi:Glycosyl transferases group 1
MAAEPARDWLSRPLRRALQASAGAIDAARLLGPTQPPPTALTWPLSEEDRARLTIRWPRVYQWTEADTWIGPLRHGMSRLVRVVDEEIPQLHRGIVAIKVELDRALHDVIIDYSDYADCNSELLDRAALYFKMQCPPDAPPRAVPGGFVPASEQIYRYLPRLRALRDQRAFTYDVYGRFSIGYATDTRGKAIALLTDQDRFPFEGGAKMISYPGYLKEIAKARICIDLPGNGALCFRQIDYLAVGACVIGPKPPVAMPVELRDGEEIVYTKPDLSDLLDRCEQYLSDDGERERIAVNARAYFDRCLDRNQLAAYYLSTMLSALA